MSDPPPLVTVVVPACDAESTLEETLRTIAGQTYRALEILIVDDGSRDSTAEIAARFCAQEPRARLIRQERKGVAGARNAAIRQARGAFIAPCDADDLWRPDKIAKQVAAARAAPEPPGFVYCWSRLIDERGAVIGYMEPFSVAGDGFAALWARNVVGNGSALLIDRACLEVVGHYDVALHSEGLQGCEDSLLQLRVAEHFPVAVVPEFLVGYRLGDGRMSSDADRMFRSWRRATRGIGRRPPLKARRWTLGYRLLTLAEHRAYGRRFAASAISLAGAFLADPLRTSQYLSYRFARTLRKRSNGPVAAPAPIPFPEWDPTVAGPEDPHALRSWERRLRRLDASRLARLRADSRPDKAGIAAPAAAARPFP